MTNLKRMMMMSTNGTKNVIPIGGKVENIGIR